MPDVDATRARPGLPSSSNLLAAGTPDDVDVGLVYSLLSLTVEADSHGRTGAVDVLYGISGVLGLATVILGWGDRDVEVEHFLGPIVTECDEWLIDAARQAHDTDHDDTAFRAAARADFDDTFGAGAFDAASALLEQKRTALRRSAMASGRLL